MVKIMNKRKMGREPVVSVILPVYNAAPYLEECLNSIYNQTFQDFEIIAVDDASSDNSLKVLRNYSKKFGKMRILTNSKNSGVSETAKKAISHARGNYLARMDADDIMSPARLRKQINYLRKHKKTVAVGGQAVLIDKNSNVIGKKSFPLSHKEIYEYIFRFIPIQQATLTIDRSRLPEDFQYYRDGMNTAEEVELFFKLFQHGNVENMPDDLLLYRYHDTNTSLLNIRETFSLTLIARIKAVFRYNYQPTFGGVIITFMQAIMIFILPKKLTILIYRTLREGSLKLTIPSFVKYLSVRSFAVK